MTLSMGMQPSGGRRVLRCGVAFAFALVSSLTCFMGIAVRAETVAAAHACCEGMNACGDIALEEDCCVTDATNLAELNPNAYRRVLPIAALAAATSTVDEPDMSAPCRASAGEQRPAHASSRPTYLMVSVFRL